MSSRAEREKRKNRMLDHVIDLYIRTGRPVSSGSLKKIYHLESSTASIRMILHQLEEEGYLCKPHVSAGRVPTDSGYRLYVDKMEINDTLSRDIIEKINNRIGKDISDLRDIMLNTSRLLGELTDYMGLMMGIFRFYGFVTGLDIIQNQGKKGLIVLKLSSGLSKSIYIEFPKRYRRHILERANRIINDRIIECPLDEAVSRLENLARESTGIEREITGCLITRASNLFNYPFDMKYYISSDNIHQVIPEFNNPAILRKLLTVMGQREVMLKLLRERVDKELSVTIGDENDLAGLNEFSIVTHRVGRDQCQGLLGVLGPKRMSYKLVLPLLSRMVQELESY
ncbi:MAG: heat-inducible transcription repressor HrcA [Candidatus Latescibacteria bacterium]|nr:heat-inducible transcription repressor HrcA [Candidatus Latescibacterota bacterium]